MMRPGVPTDLPRLEQLVQVAFPPLTDFALASELVNAAASVWVYESAGELVGFINFRCAPSWEILAVGVAPSQRRRGLASALIRAVLVQAEGSKADAVWLEVRAENHAARALYAGLGFRDVRRRAAYYRDGEDAIVMQAVLQ